GEPDPDNTGDYQRRLKALCLESGAPITWGLFSSRQSPDRWRRSLALLDTTAAEGGHMFAQVHSRALNVLYTFESYTPLDPWYVWRDIRALPLAEQKAKLRDPAIKAELVDVAGRPSERHARRGVHLPPPDWDWIFIMDSMSSEKERRMSEVAAERGVPPAELMINLGLESDFKVFFRKPLNNDVDDHVLEMMLHPQTVVTFSDSGAHVSQIMDSSLQTHVFSHWVREKQALTVEQAVRMVTSVPARRWGLTDRGLLRPGHAADVTVFDPATIASRMPEVVHDLPGGGRRFKQVADGIKATVVNGEVLLRDNVHTGAASGQLLRGPLAAA
ncbi:MAG: amidohydrolase family protein, partial [Gammaproteobacteria bacterium]|nr:amidohydrolase family protein [Gammaproteobacteria bacterium]